MTNTKLVLVLSLASACAPTAGRYPLQAPLWSDPDRNTVPSRPGKRFSGLLADGADQIVFRRMAETLAFRHPGEAANVNSLDEVPASSWFENRIGLHAMTPEEARLGSCGQGPHLDGNRGPWRITAAKPDGANPGFFVTAPDGSRYLLKMDSHYQPERATTADVVGSKLFHAAGYFTPCNEIVTFPRGVLVIDPHASRKDDVGADVPITQRDVDAVLAAAIQMPDGTLRASASRFVPGQPLGPFRYEGTRADDPNDVIPHEDRRELRAARLFAAWVNHFDAREQNSLDVWVNDGAGGRRYLRHYLVDWGDSMGSIWDKEEISRRLGHGGYADWDQITVDLVTLGLYPRPWHRAVRSDRFGTFGYFGSHDFAPRDWRAGYPNPAFQRMTDRDGLWAARILARISDDHLRAMVSAARLSDPADAAYLIRTLAERRDRILATYMDGQSGLTRFMLVRRHPGDLAQSLCFEDDALRTGRATPDATHYRVVTRIGEQPEVVLAFSPDPAHAQRSCIRLPLGDQRPSDLVIPATPDDHPGRYQMIDIATERPAGSAIIRVHLYDLGPARGYQIVGLERAPRKAI
jgi:hypothetical protein